MQKGKMFGSLVVLTLLAFQGCATAPPSLGVSSLIPLEKANLEAVLEEHEGLEIFWEDAKELRDFYRGGVQKKAEAEKRFREKNYPEALKFYDSSNEFLRVVLKYSDRDCVEFPLFEGTSILFLPNLLVADNHLKAGRILREMGRENSARRKWKQALPFIELSLESENTEWAMSVRQDLLSLLNSKER